MKLSKTYGTNAKAAAALIDEIANRSATSAARVETTVSTILADIRQGGDAALTEYAARFDGLQCENGKSQSLRVTPAEMAAAWASITPALQEAMQIAQANIRAFAEAQRPTEWTIEPTPGLTTGQIIRPIDAVGCYVPGGRYPLPSTLFMTVTPAQVAGVPRIVVCSPRPAPETLAAAHLAGVTEFYRLGGAQAVAALAYGTESIKRVEKIVGPGNLYVTAAKTMVSHECGIDMPAGPTEIGIISQTGDAPGIAADLIAQAEHDPEALAILITASESLGKAVLAEVKSQLKAMPPENVTASDSLSAQGHIFVTKTVTEAQTLTNLLAFEHLSVDDHSDLAWVSNAGSVFIGRFSPQSMGDYISGPNHVLPTGRTGRIRGGLSVNDFLKVITIQQYTRKALTVLGPHAIALAEAEGLTAHAQSIRIKLNAKLEGKA